MKHAAIFTRLAKRVDPNIPILEAAMGEIEALEKDYQQACLLVSQMHRAAMNDVIGPKRGVVEDILDLREERDELKAMNDELKQVRCEGCGYLVTEREHLGCHSEKTLKALAAAEESFNQQHRINAELVEQAELLAAQNEALRSALEIIAGKRLCCDNLMSNVDVAEAALNLHNLTTEILRKRDAATLRRASKRLGAERYEKAAWYVEFLAAEIEKENI